MNARAAREQGFTLIEVLTYLALFTFFTGTIVASEVLARRINRNESALLSAVEGIDRLFARLADDADAATEVAPAIAGAGDIRFEGAATYTIDAGRNAILRDGKALVSNVVSARFERDPARPRLLRVTVRLRRDDGPDAFDRTYERIFYLPGVRGAGEGDRGPY